MKDADFIMPNRTILYDERIKRYIMVDEETLKEVYEKFVRRYYSNNNWRKRHHIPMRRRDGRRKDIGNEWSTRLMLLVRANT